MRAFVKVVVLVAVIAPAAVMAQGGSSAGIVGGGTGGSGPPMTTDGRAAGPWVASRIPTNMQPQGSASTQARRDKARMRTATGKRASTRPR